MQDKFNKILYIIIFVLLFFLGLSIIIENINKEKEYTNNMFYMDTYIYIKLYTNDSKKASEAIKKVDELYSKYDALANKYKKIEGISNLYYITYNTSGEEKIKIDHDLYELIKYGISAYEKTSGLVDISMGNVLDIWHSYRTAKIGVPTIEELNSVNTSSIDDIKLLEDDYILNNHVNIDLGAIAKGYVTNLAGEILKEEGIDKYIINAGGNVLLGDAFDLYSVGIEDPDNENGIIKIIYAKDISVVTSGGYLRFYEWEGKRYSHIIDPNTLYPKDYMKSVTVITKDSAYADILSTMLYLKSVEEGKKIVESLEGVEAIWYTNDNKIIKSSGIKNYEKK